MHRGRIRYEYSTDTIPKKIIHLLTQEKERVFRLTLPHRVESTLKHKCLRTWSHQHSPKLGSCTSSVYSSNSKPILRRVNRNQSLKMSACTWTHKNIHANLITRKFAKRELKRGRVAQRRIHNRSLHYVHLYRRKLITNRLSFLVSKKQLRHTGVRNSVVEQRDS